MRNFCCGLFILLSLFGLVASRSNSGKLWFKHEKFSCAKRPCGAGGFNNYANDSFMHFMVGLDDVSAFPLLLHRLCEGLQKCIPASNFLIILHTTVPDETALVGASTVLKSVGVERNVVTGNFSAIFKMMSTMELLTKKGVTKENQFLYHTDLDEIPKNSAFAEAMKEIKSGSCDAIGARWTDRLSNDGSLQPILATNNPSLGRQFPMMCHISSNYMEYRVLWKVIVYRANYRAASGQHYLWCDDDADRFRREDKRSRSFNFNNTCKAHIKKRPFSEPEEDAAIFSHLPVVKKLPRICNTLVELYHYKFVDGVREELIKRADSYKRMGLPWYKQSEQIVEYMDKHDGRIDIKNPKFKCVQGLGFGNSYKDRLFRESNRQRERENTKKENQPTK